MRSRTQTRYPMTFDFSVHPDWQAYSTKRQDIHRQIHELKWKQEILLMKITQLELAQDLVMRKKYIFENPSKKTTQVLLDVSGDCDQCWFSKFDTCEEEIKELRINKCIEISAIQSQINILNHDSKVLSKEQDECRDRLIKEHKDANDSTRNKKPAIASAA